MQNYPVGRINGLILDLMSFIGNFSKIIHICPETIELFFMLNSTEHEIPTAHEN